VVFWVEAVVGGAGFALAVAGLAVGAQRDLAASAPGTLLQAGVHGLLGDGLWLLVMAPAAAVAASAIWGFATRRVVTAVLALVALAAIASALLVRV
jgi:hypothetical protein